MKKSFNIISILLIAGAALSSFYRFKDWNFDDGYIVFRIVKNMLAGHGWAYNIAEIHNASTSALNTVVLYIGALFSKDIPFVSHTLGTIWILLSGVCAYYLFKKYHDNIIGLITGIILVNHLAWNYTWGIETNLFIFTLLLFIIFEEQKINSWPLIGILVLIRPDALLIAGLKWLKEFHYKKDLSIKGVVLFILVLLPWAIYSFMKFGRVFPDTLSEKVWQGSSGFWGHGYIYAKAFAKNIINTTPLYTATYVLAIPRSLLPI